MLVLAQQGLRRLEAAPPVERRSLPRHLHPRRHGVDEQAGPLLDPRQVRRAAGDGEAEEHVVRPGISARLAESFETAIGLADGIAIAEFADKAPEGSLSNTPVKVDTDTMSPIRSGPAPSCSANNASTGIRTML